ncbi:RNase LS, toxin [Bacillus wiedmannii]|uniref:RNase LS, toxin n=1 Tax=Bacillus wiedmannii TaxID=1890302 RepID=A0A1G7FM37_9BACI|nr:RNase LS family HEPN domain-containing protein [Bacillus wiedmannii]SDE76899.1 RNase LS, toxin [Bacillus wiedmannii]
MAKAKKKSYYINKENLEGIIKDYCEIKSIECKNPANNQTRYTLVKDAKEFYLDVYFKVNNTISMSPVNMGENVDLARELESIIDSSSDYSDVTRGTFSAKISLEQFSALIEYINALKGVEKTNDVDKGANGRIVKFITDFGDSVTLTYYESKEKLNFQGLFMNLYVIIKSYITPLEKVSISETSIFKTVSNVGNVEKLIGENLPKGYKLLDEIMAGFISDSFTMIVADTKLNDYASWVMPTMRVLEHAIKRVCLDNDIYLNDEQGFSYYIDDDQERTARLFFMNSGNIVINRDLTRHLTITLDPDTIDILVRCYDYLKKNRHEMFHTVQLVEGTKLVTTPEEARGIIIGACELIEESLIFKI